MVAHTSLMRLRVMGRFVLVVSCLFVVVATAVNGSSVHQQLEHRTLFHLQPTALHSPITTSATIMQSMTTRSSSANKDAPSSHQHGHINARASSTVHVLSFTKVFEKDATSDAPPAIDHSAPLLAVPTDVQLIDLSSDWSTHPQLNRLIQLQCGIFMMDYCTDSIPVEEDGAVPWDQLKLDQPCILPLIHHQPSSIDSSDSSSVVSKVAGVSVVLFLPPHAASSSSPSHIHAEHENHHGFPYHRSAYWSNQCQLSLANEFELDYEGEQHLTWINADGSASNEARFFSDFPVDLREESDEASIATDSENVTPAMSSPASIWSDTSMPAYFTEVYHQFQVSLSRRAIPAVSNTHPDEEDQDLLFVRSPKTKSNSSSEDTDEFSFLETDAVVDVMDSSSVLAELHARELADTNDMYRLMGQLTDATRTGASSTVVWELVIRPCVNILRKILLYALRQLMARVLIKGLHKLVTSAINPVDPPPDESEYTKPPVEEVEDPEELWSSAPAPMPDPIVPPPEHGTELLEVDNTVFLSSEHTIGVKGILDPMLEFLVPTLHNTITQSTHDIAQKGMTKSIQMHSIAPMKEQIHASVHKKSVEMLTAQLTEQVTEHVTTHLIAQLPRTLTILCTQDVHKSLSRPLTFSLAYSLTYALTRSPQQDYECKQCTDESTKCSACDVTKANDYYINYYTNYYAKYFEKYYTFYYTEYYGRLFANDALKAADG